jgi:hypothetical protein
MFLEITITVYDPLDRKLNLQKELAPFFVSNTEWNNCTSKGIYVSCGNYFVMKKMEALGLKYISEPDAKKENADALSLMLYCGMVTNQGYTFSEEEMAEIKELNSQHQVLITPELPPGEQFDGIREQFNSIRNVLELFKNRLN